MCYGQEETPFSRHHQLGPRWRLPLPPSPATNTDAEVDNLRLRLAETEARIARARAREAQLTRRLAQMKRFVSVMEILDSYLKRRFRQQQQRLPDPISNPPLAARNYGLNLAYRSLPSESASGSPNLMETVGARAGSVD